MEHPPQPSRESAAAWLEGHAAGIADALVDPREAPAARASLLRDAAAQLDYLRVAIARAAPALFLDYVTWSRVLLASQQRPAEELRAHLERLEETLAKQAPPELAAPLTEVVKRARAELPAMPTEVPGFIQPGHPHAVLARRYLDLLLAGDRAAATRVITAAAEEGVAVRELYLDVFQPILREVGRLWQLNQVTVAHEHYCTAATQLVMSLLYPRIFSSPRVGRTLVATCVEGDLHEIGVRMVADFFEMAGWDSHYLGANVPSQSVVSTIAARRPDAVAISATISRHVPRVAELIARIREAAPKTRVLVGGYPFNVEPELWRSVGADAHARDAAQSVTVAEQALVAP